MIWYFTNEKIHAGQNENNFYTNLLDDPNHCKNIQIHIDGYVVPRSEYFNQYKELSQINLVKSLFIKHGKAFTNYIKGIFSVIIISENKFFIASDQHSIKSCFIYKNNDVFFISNSLKVISEYQKLNIDYENAAIFSLLSHYIDGQTLFKNVSSCKPGQIIEFDGKTLLTEFYWDPIYIIKSRFIKKSSVRYYSVKWQNIISNYINYLNPKGISITLTGGNDSRMVLSALLSLKKPFHAFTFGNPNSYDGVIAGKIKENFPDNYSNYFTYPTADWFENHANKVVEYGNSLINIHRAHRNDALEREKIIYPESEMIFTGLVGGEYLKEPNYDNIVLPVLFKQLLSISNESEALLIIKKQLELKGIITNSLELPIVYKRIKNFLDKGKDLNEKEIKFLFIYLFYGCAHHNQDSNVFGNHIKYVINPFMDIDFLEIIANNEKWYLNKKQNIIDRLFHSELIVSVTDFLYPDISGIPYAKKGKYTANDLLRNKIKYILKRTSYFIYKDKDKFPANFPMGDWLFEFCEKKINNLSRELQPLFDLEFLKNQLTNNKGNVTEESWHIFTNPVNISMNCEFFKDN